MSYPENDDNGSHSEQPVAIPRLAEEVGATPREMRYWEEQGLISPTRQQGRLRYVPRDLAIARLVKRLVDAGIGIDGIRELRSLSERGVRSGATDKDEAHLAELALGILYATKAFRDLTGTEPDRFLRPDLTPPTPKHGPKHAD